MSIVWQRPRGWPSSVRLGYTTRDGGVSAAPYSSFNLGTHVGDAAEAVLENRRRLQRSLPTGSQIAWLTQIHGTRVVEAQSCLNAAPEADAVWTSRENLACAVMTADCLPVLLTDDRGACVAAVHAGWRGLAAGVLESAIAALPARPAALLAYLGPCIGAEVFEVGGEVREAFLSTAANNQRRGIDACFREAPHRPGRLLANLEGLARQRLLGLGVRSTQSASCCTVSTPERFYSYRRDAVTGRNASLILRVPGASSA